MAALLDPRLGATEPTSGTPARRPGSIRRTSTVDSVRPDGIDKALVQVGRARDLFTASDGTPTVVAESELWVRTVYRDGPIVEELELFPAAAGLESLRGRRASTGFRAAIDDAVDLAHGSLGYLLLDEIPAATLVSGYAMAVVARRGDVDMAALNLRGKAQPVLQFPDLCAGFRVGGTMEASLDEQGRPPILTGPVALAVDDDDEWAWHAFDALPADSMRRRRRIDVCFDAPDLVRVDVFFRDSHMAPDGVETAVHEYTVDVTVDPSAMRVVDCTATPRVLPWRECPEAAASAGRLAGMPLAGLRPEVRATFVGPSTCTHLNDVLRGLEDVEWLARELAARAGG